MAGRLADKVALVAGAGPNMGRAVATLFAQEGAKVVVAARSAESTAGTVERIERFGGAARAVQADVSTEAGAQSVTQAAVAAFGRLDIMYHNAGGFFTPKYAVESLPADFWEGALANNLRSLYWLTRQAVPHLEAGGGGCIITVSAADLVVQDANSAYAAAKAGLIGAARNLARELFPKNIRVHAMCPGIMWEQLAESADGHISPASRQLDRLGNAADVAYAALWLASDEAAWVTGLAVNVDGGDAVFAESPRRRRAVEARLA
jgi:3-oxoacyl-[acyl-carrier protein] reductase